MNKPFAVLSFFLLLQACAQVDDYMLGKDNTPKPAVLEPIHPRVKLVETWSIASGKAAKSSMYLKLKPAVVGDVVYTADAAGMVQAVDKNSARVLWSKQLKNGVISGPTVARGYIALGTNAATVILLNQTNGEQLWESKVSSDALSKPVIANNKVLVKTIDGNLFAFGLTSGEKLWVSDHGAPPLILKASSSPVIVDKVALVGFSDGKLDAIDLDSGSLVWQRGIAYASGASDVERLVDIDADPIVRGNVAYLAGYQGYIGALSLTDGQFIWRKPASTYKNLAMDASTLYMTDSDDVVWAFDAHNGQVKWKQIALKARSLTEPVLMGNRLVIGDKTGFLHVLSAQTGEFLSRTQLGGSIDIAPAVSGNNLYVMTANGKLNRLSVS
ncbi:MULTISPECIES: outer membrane protein assembly factor BamB [Legionella]|uniref:Outer membrane protein assembly factor BamB n=1 Tax=Legionella septentrionalis TaxID=2498109 RepID=A0A3S0X4B3_9GAMM|nr:MULTISPECIES: outer membrane protein assembly factor BamB [Legionella]MCP0912878.1 outer membrane protein assembly factor BamB [Legionella sp. 27cVA30]RUQ88352.1 outer membrane protein assembly factor BamB [Legionella septentrionalis]RUQ95078.1 outer membrane protein assembly factor BamB [Legionella septentrionalis]RUR09458.1 outer membrane protein assembly factor BamB [Legionella septentrionalis]RUR13710.1 outer membrane protein assembly factor BamB [Legionella septentrionalis]